ncbi:response regulator [Sulfitobacter sp. S223]|uniref:response regulator n=1 Tax=Sulfitobacter sp. S223 TaxID=2867023 RepID=UPI0021A46E4E|nr:response regulator [Sulfitobacter sp. S223]UWR25676.1 response regulator [Sulfitobacter sp. S223]
MRFLRGTAGYERTPILMLTAMAEKGYIDSAFGAGATDYISKPFELNGLRGRLNLVEPIANDIREREASILASETPENKLNAALPFVELHEPFSIMDVDGVIENYAIENYVTQLSRKSLCGSVALGFTIREVADMYYEMSNYDFTCMVTDVSEAISDCLAPAQRLLSYAGNGTFVSVIEGASHIDIGRLVDQINRQIYLMELSQSNGERLDVRICAGKMKRMVWRKGDAAVDALREAHDSAEQNAYRLKQELGNIWTTAQTA